jgi:hypothetical protein
MDICSRGNYWHHKAFNHYKREVLRNDVQVISEFFCVIVFLQKFNSNGCVWVVNDFETVDFGINM